MDKINKYRNKKETNRKLDLLGYYSSLSPPPPHTHIFRKVKQGEDNCGKQGKTTSRNFLFRKLRKLKVRPLTAKKKKKKKKLGKFMVHLEFMTSSGCAQ
jgi:hypothetical protein